MIRICNEEKKTKRVDVDFGLGTLAISLFDNDKKSLLLHLSKKVSEDEIGKIKSFYYEDYPVSHKVFLNFMSIESIDYLIKMLELLKERKLDDSQDK